MDSSTENIPKTIFIDYPLDVPVKKKIVGSKGYLTLVSSGGSGSSGTDTYSGAGGGSGAMIRIYELDMTYSPLTITSVVGSPGILSDPDAKDLTVEVLDSEGNKTEIKISGGTGAVDSVPGVGGKVLYANYIKKPVEEPIVENVEENNENVEENTDEPVAENINSEEPVVENSENNENVEEKAEEPVVEEIGLPGEDGGAGELDIVGGYGGAAPFNTRTRGGDPDHPDGYMSNYGCGGGGGLGGEQVGYGSSGTKGYVYISYVA